MEKEQKVTTEEEAKKLLEEYDSQAESNGKHSYSERWHSEDASDGCCC